MRPETISLVRHGQSCGNADKTRFKTVTDDRMDLTPEGELQAAAAIPTLRGVIGEERALFYVSPYRRCRTTLSIIRSGFARDQISVIEDNHLRERKIGNLIEVEEYHSAREGLNTQGFFYRPPNGEAMAEVYTRSELFRASMRSRWESESHPRHVVIVGHNSALKTFLMCELQISAAHFSEIGTIGNAEVITLKPHKTGFGIQYLPAQMPIGITREHINSTYS